MTHRLVDLGQVAVVDPTHVEARREIEEDDGELSRRGRAVLDRNLDDLLLDDPLGLGPNGLHDTVDDLDRGPVGS